MPKIARRHRFPATNLFAALALFVGLMLVYAAAPVHAADSHASARTSARAGETRMAALATASAQDKSEKITIGRETGLPLPRFVSLKFKTTNLRAGPGTKHRVDWAYKRKGLPVEVFQEFGRWRRIRDSEGVTGWVLHSLLSSHRTAIVAPWRRAFELKAGSDLADLALLNAKSNASANAATVARFQPGLQVGLKGCSDGWCAVEVKSVTAFLQQDKLWGVYQNEKFGG